ncbi:MAG TPA: hypothetical protein VI136_00435 [Verrucomicrobiae bacterium]
MKPQFPLHLAIAALLLAAPVKGVVTPVVNPSLPSVASSSTPTPEFDGFIRRLEACGGLIPAFSQWTKVLKPTLLDLGYSNEQIKQVKGALSKKAVTLADARLFSERWQVRYREQINPASIYAFLRDEKPSPKTVELAAR